MALMRTAVNRRITDIPAGQDDTRAYKREVGEEMSDVTLRSIVKEEIHTAVGFVGGDVSEDRRRAMDYYLGDPFGNEQEGRSQFVSTDVQDVVESVMPDLVEIFASGEDVVRFEPEGPEDEPIAEQATDYVNHIWFKDNPGFAITHDWIKDALLQKNGIIKIHWDESEETKRETLTGINSLMLAELEADDEVEVVELDEVQIDDPALIQFAPDGVLYDATLTRTSTKGRVCIESVPPEEFLIARRSVGLEPRYYEFACHKTRKTVSDLIEMGFDPDDIESIPSHDDQDYNEERISRFDDDEWPELDDSLDPAMREIWLYECYLKVDYDGDGITEMRQVTVAGPGYDILSNELIDEHPFASITPIRMPHKFFGRSLADLVSDIQLIKSTIQRQLLDNMYNINNNSSAISNKVDIDDYLVQRPGRLVRVDTDAPDVAGHVAPMVTQPIIGDGMPLLEYWDSMKEDRTGVTRLNQGLDSESLNKTATGINQLLGRTQKRILLMARVFAETGFAPAMKKVLKLVVNHQDQERVIRLRNQWVPMDPRSWNTDMDMSISVGIGHGTREQQSMMYERILLQQQNAIQLQGGIEGPLVTGKNVYNTTRKWLQFNGIKDPDLHVTNPDMAPPPPPPPPDPKMIEAQVKQGQLQLDQQRLQLDQQKFMLEAQEKGTKAQLEYQGKSQEAQRANAEALATIQGKEQELVIKARELAAREREVEAKQQLAALQAEASILKAQAEKAGDEARTELQIREVQHKIDLAEKEHQIALEQLQIEREKLKVEKAKIAAGTKESNQDGKGSGGSAGVTVNMGGDKSISFERDEQGNLKGATVKESAPKSGKE